MFLGEPWFTHPNGVQLAQATKYCYNVGMNSNPKPPHLRRRNPVVLISLLVAAFAAGSLLGSFFFENGTGPTGQVIYAVIFVVGLAVAYVVGKRQST